jgi:hypothetical protein
VGVLALGALSAAVRTGDPHPIPKRTGVTAIVADEPTKVAAAPVADLAAERARTEERAELDPAPAADAPSAVDSRPASPSRRTTLRATRRPEPPPPVDEPAAQDPSSTLLEEVASLDAARRALARGNAASAVSLLVAHEARFPSGTLTPEARVLRIRALLAAGRRAEAERLASQFLAANPGSPHAARIRSLLSGR